jgi:hypothetical protein
MQCKHVFFNWRTKNNQQCSYKAVLEGLCINHFTIKMYGHHNCKGKIKNSTEG